MPTCSIGKEKKLRRRVALIVISIAAAFAVLPYVRSRSIFTDQTPSTL
jgi:hypothetical protein